MKKDTKNLSGLTSKPLVTLQMKNIFVVLTLRASYLYYTGKFYQHQWSGASEDLVTNNNLYRRHKDIFNNKQAF